MHCPSTQSSSTSSVFCIVTEQRSDVDALRPEQNAKATNTPCCFLLPFNHTKFLVYWFYIQLRGCAAVENKVLLRVNTLFRVWSFCASLIARAESLRRRDSVDRAAVALDTLGGKVAGVGQDVLALFGVGGALGVQRVLHDTGSSGKRPGVHTAVAKSGSGAGKIGLAKLSRGSNDGIESSRGGDGLQTGESAGLGNLGAGGVARIAGESHDPLSGNGASDGAKHNNDFVHDGHTK